MASFLVRTLLLGICLLLTAQSYQHLQTGRQSLDSASLRQQEALYLPSGRGLEFISFKFKNVLADVLWFNTINYFGKHYRSDRDYTWLNHMCGLITTLDTRAEHVYEFCSLMLAWEAGQPEESIKLLDKAIRAEPNHWRYYYLRGIDYAFFLHDEDKARRDFVEGAKVPNAHPLMARLASKKMALSSPETALAFLAEMIKNSSDQTQKAALLEHFKKLQHELKSQNIESQGSRLSNP